MEEQHYSICWNCRRSFECLQAEAISTKTCPTFEERPKPPGPARPPTRDLSRRLWANTPDHLHPKPWTSTDPKSQELADLRAQLAAERQRAEALCVQLEASREALTEAMGELREAGEILLGRESREGDKSTIDLASEVRLALDLNEVAQEALARDIAAERQRAEKAEAELKENQIIFVRLQRDYDAIEVKARQARAERQRAEAAEAERDRLREQLRLATEALVTGKAFRDTLVKCSTVGWPSEVIKAFYTWQPELFAVLVAIKQGGNKTDVLTLPHHGTLIESAEQSDTFSVVTEETVTGGG